MAWKFSPDRPIYLQIADRLTAEIVSGQRPAGTRIPTVRDLALDAGVNPNTAQRALSELERSGYLETRRGDGRYVAEEDEKLRQERRAMLVKESTAFVRAMKNLGFSDAEIREQVDNTCKDTADAGCSADN